MAKEAAVRISDITASNIHCYLKYENGKFYLEDNESKYGSVVLVKNKMPIFSGVEKSCQVGRSILNFSVEKVEKVEKFEETKEESLKHYDSVFIAKSKSLELKKKANKRSSEI